MRSPVFRSDDTIVAIATPIGRGGIGVVRLSGPESRHVAAALVKRSETLKARYATLVRINAAAGTADEAIMTFFPAPHSYTGEDVVEISAHGSPVLLRAIVDSAMRAGARLAEPGEFTFRAFLNGRLDLVQAEAVRDLIEAVTPLQARTAFDQLEGTLTCHIHGVETELFELTTRLEASLDFPEEGYHFIDAGATVETLDAIINRLRVLLASAGRGRLIREGLNVVITGRPNAGKSSLFNQLVGAGRAIVTEIPGTTRDLLTEVVDVDGVPITFIDTAGVRAGMVDAVEAEGIARAVAARDVASTVVLVLDRSEPLTEDDRMLLAASGSRPWLVVANKSDLPPASWFGSMDGFSGLSVSAKTGEGLGQLRAALTAALTAHEAYRETPAITNTRHVKLLERAKESLEMARAAARANTPEEFVLADIHEARGRLEEITGARTADDVLHAIFDMFCIGK
jgi:tRNA modification GTPase